MRKYWFVYYVLIWMPAAPLQSQPPVDSLRVLHEVVVLGQRATVADIIPVQTLSGEALQRLSAHSVADAIRYFSGVQIKDYGGIGGLKTVNIRSLGTNHVGVFYDGIELGNAQNGQIDLGRFALDNMDAVAVYNGQKSAVLQPAKDYASAGAVYMYSRKPVFDDGKRNNVRAGFKTGSFDLANPSLLWEHKLNRYVEASVGAEYLTTSGKYKFTYAKKNGYDTTEVRQNGDVSMLRAEAALYGTVRNGEWKVKAYFYDSERGYPGAAVRETPGVFKHADRQWDDNFFLQASFRKTLTPAYRLLLNGKYAYDYLHYLSDPRLDISTMYVENRYRQQEAYFSSAHEYAPAGWWRASLASDFQYNTLDADLTDFVYPSRCMMLTVAAISLQWDVFRMQASLLHTFVHDATRKPGGAAGRKSAFTPTVAASFKPWREQDIRLRAFYKRVFRLPTFNDLYYTFIGNKLLLPEYTTQYNIGITASRGIGGSWLQRLDAQADVYYNEVENKIVAMPTDNQFRWMMVNLGEVEIRGIEVSLCGEWQAGAARWSTRLTYTCQQAQDCTDPTSPWYRGQIPYIPRHSGSAIVSGTYGRWSFNYSFIYTGERYESTANIPENYSPAWYTHDVSVARRIPVGKTVLRITAEVNNILNQAYEVVQCYPMPGMNFKGIIALEF
ncbi:MAG: TonB-dependent receptor [Prevotellaceae bacterium]|jgi:outer membrane cobalamin receptor|nr:TonB-dependent receptor [Prevotellaceae bacterium]